MNPTIFPPEQQQPVSDNEFEHFVEAHNRIYGRAVEELAHGKQKSDWMPFIFPEFAGIETGYLAVRFAINSLYQAQRYLAHPILSEHLHQCTELVVHIQNYGISEIFHCPNDLKFHSSMTLFSLAAPEDPTFADALLKYFGGHPDVRTVDIVWLTHQRKRDL